jgi:hypothetical protein
LAVTTAVAVLTATPAQAALVYQGTFTIQFQFVGCAQVENNGTTNRTPIQLRPCTGIPAQRWARYLATDQNNLWFLAYDGVHNLCMDRGGAAHVWIYGCHGGSQQRWIHNSLQQIVSVDNGGCLNVGNPFSNIVLALSSCVVSGGDARAPAWFFVPA